MKTDKYTLRVLTGGLLVTLLLAPVAAQTVYKSTRPDGSVVYSDKPSKDAAKVEQVDQSKISVQPPSARPSASGPTDTRLRDKNAALDSAQARIEAAQQALDAARQRLQEGADPLPGERTGTVGGNSRLNEAYNERMRSLQQDVTEAAQRLDQAYEQRKALRN